jgi:hypothetical protein
MSFLKRSQAGDGLWCMSTSYEISPMIRVPVFSAADLERGRDSAVEKALEILGEPRR